MNIVAPQWGQGTGAMPEGCNTLKVAFYVIDVGTTHVLSLE